MDFWGCRKILKERAVVDRAGLAFLYKISALPLSNLP